MPELMSILELSPKSINDCSIRLSKASRLKGSYQLHRKRVAVEKELLPTSGAWWSRNGDASVETSGRPGRAKGYMTRSWLILWPPPLIKLYRIPSRVLAPVGVECARDRGKGRDTAAT
ncbi:DNA-binding protein with HTH domain [Striga asiatica]|uniref:DNA-binding protein with HTH domain n=1 Tax=Striga asiatica TaxID=4170 RepID=A0A5A7RCP4_STRAF|nr:DNA-binding protein with HTH domain [Striga asiatica]